MLAVLPDPNRLPSTAMPKDVRDAYSADLRLQPVYTGLAGPDGSLSQVFEVPGSQCVWNETLQCPVAVVGPKYRLVPPKALWDLAEVFCEQFGLTVSSAGVFGDGRNQSISLAYQERAVGSEVGEVRINLLNSCDGSSKMRVFPSIWAPHTELVYLPLDRSEVASLTHVGADVLDKATETTSKMLEGCLKRVTVINEAAGKKLKSLPEFQLFLRNAVYKASTDEVLNNKGSGKGFLDRMEHLEAALHAYCGERDASVFDALYCYSHLLDWEPLGSRKVDIYTGSLARMSGVCYSHKAEATSLILANAGRLSW